MEATGYAKGRCPKCGKELGRPRPASESVCDCYMYCPDCGAEMVPYNPDMDANSYRMEDILDPQGLAEKDEKAMDTLYRCGGCGHYSSLKPQVVPLY